VPSMSRVCFLALYSDVRRLIPDIAESANTIPLVTSGNCNLLVEHIRNRLFDAKQGNLNV
jgi:hypothetical protein